MGAPVLGMHSIRELAAVKDNTIQLKHLLSSLVYNFKINYDF